MYLMYLILIHDIFGIYDMNNNKLRNKLHYQQYGGIPTSDTVLDTAYTGQYVVYMCDTVLQVTVLLG